MAESDNEDEKFVKNVIHELSAFQKSGSPGESKQASESVYSKERPTEMNGPEHDSGVEGNETVAVDNGSLKENKTEPESSNTPVPEATKQPNRIIRLSRPYNPYNSARTTVTSVTSAGSSVSTSAQSSSSTVNGTVSSTAVGAGAPGSRLAALQRPGSPMHRILQRAQSPALAAAARLTRQASGDGTQAGITAETTPGVKTLEQTGNAGDQQTTEYKPVSTSEPGNGDNATEQPRSVIPPRIQSSNLTSSILLRRPRSPLNTGKSQLLIHKQTSYQNDDGTSPNSPLSPGHSSPGDSKMSSSNEDSQTADKIAIRNKLRANSFRLKDLLTKKPFVRSREGVKDENGEESSDQNSNNSNSESGEKVEGIKEMTSRIGEAGTDRTRWRREGIASLSRSRSTASDRTATLISARTIRTRTRTSAQSSTDEKNSNNCDNHKTVEKNENISIHSEAETNILNSDGGKSDNTVTMSQGSDRAVKLDDLAANKHDSEVAASGQRTRVTVGATLLRSPRTRTPSGSTVPSSPVEKTGSQNSSEDISGSNRNSQRESSDISKSDNEADADRKMKAISDLEKDNDVNLVFDSDSIGQPVTPDFDKETNEKIKVYRRSQSEFNGSQPHAEESPKLHRNYSEPACPTLEQSSIRSSKSYDNNPDTEFPRSPALKRCLAVTDLDKAMRDRDQQKLSSIFRESSKDSVETQSKVPCSEDKTEVLKHQDSQLETDLDARMIPSHRLVTSSPRIKERLTGSQEGPKSPPHSAPPVNPVAPMVYRPNVNLEDAVKWPIDLPGKLDFRKMEVFEGQMLLNWLSSSIDKSHYLRLVMTKHDINVIVCQVCTCLIAAGVMKQLEGKDQESVFKTDCMYYWTHTQQSSPNVNQDVNKLQPMWPPTQEQAEDNRPGLKYTEADHQAAMVTLRHEYKEEVETIQREHQGVLDKARQEYENRLQQAIERISVLQKEVEKYKCLAGIEKYSQNALSEADAAQLEAGLKPEGVNGFTTPMMHTPSVSQYHTPAGTPDGVNSNYPINVIKSSNELFSEFRTPQDGQQDGASCSGSDTTSLAGSIGEWSEGSSSLAPPPPAPPPPPGVPPPPAPPLPEALVKRPLKPVINPASPMRPLFWNRIQVNDVKTPKHKEYFEKKLVWEDLQEEKIDVQELDQLFSKRNVEPSRRFSPNKPKNKANQVAKVISPKRSQVIGILLSSLRLEMSDIEHAILTFDTSQLGEEKLRQIYENRGDNDEMKKIKEHIKKHPDTPLDKPDQFLYDLSLIPDYAERIFCFIFREAFQDSVSVIETKMTNLRMTCQSLMTSIHVKRILGLVLGLGNYMNGGSKSRGQADGFGIDILPKLKDVKSKDNSTSLLHYLVQQYIKKFEHQDAGTEKVKFPLPDPSDLTQGCQVCFDELEKELRRIKKDFEAAEERADKVIRSAREHVYLQPFKDIMTEFFEKGRQEFIEQEENLADGKRLFQETVIYFCVKPKSGDKEVTPEYFFSCWCTFCQDFKDTWKREEQKIIKQRIKENEQRLKQMQQKREKKPVRTRTRKAGGLKDRLMRQGLLES